MKTSPVHDDRQSRLIISVAVGTLVLALVILVALLVGDETESGHEGSSCPAGAAGVLNPVTCQPYGSTGAAVPGASESRSSARKPVQQPKAPAVKMPAAPKAPAPPRVSVGRR
ncbi:hypothetical protein [Streptomyces cahuitamycinicus]|uniref:Uncharacterized protein n=1 Tax=Streptomyces cahuitamycinicus TaxID=2070367 RepID=A0A2N8TTG3_9ACTN|nr:hypothetical protein [Streptomyces cahuitamycinicus]PNG22314.1 hypothetical protein C1J00_09880 [Streptomyces cahuitamycinicus]